MADKIPADLTPMALERLYKSTLRQAKAAAQDVEDCLEALIEKGNPLSDGVETGQQYAILKAEAKRVNDLSLKSVAIANALHQVQLGNLTQARAELGKHSESLRLAAEADPTKALGAGKPNP